MVSKEFKFRSSLKSSLETVKKKVLSINPVSLIKEILSNQQLELSKFALQLAGIGHTEIKE
jgi:hypothetical protein